MSDADRDNGDIDIDFLPSYSSSSQTADEELSVGRARRIPRELLGVIVVLAVVVVGAVLLARSGHKQGTTLPSQSISPSINPNSIAPPPGPTRVDPRNVTQFGTAHVVPPSYGDPNSCPSYAQCTTQNGVAAGLLRTVLHYFPNVMGQSGLTVVRTGRNSPRNPLWFQQLNAVGHNLELLVMVSASPSLRIDTKWTVTTTDGVTIGYISRMVGPFTIQVQVMGRSPFDPPMTTLRALAYDKRLTAAP